MTHRARTRLTTVLLIFVPLLAFGLEARAKSFSLPEYGMIELDVPRSWQDGISPPKTRGGSPTIEFSAREPVKFQLLISPIAVRGDGAAFMDAPAMRRKTAQSAGFLKQMAAEREVPVQELEGGTATGYFFSISNRAPKPGQYKYLTQGMARIGDLLLGFTLLAVDGHDGIRDRMFAALQGASFTVDPSRPPAAGDQAARRDSIRIERHGEDYVLSVPVSRLTMRMPGAGLTRASNSGGGATDNPRYFFFSNKEKGLTVSGWFEPEHKFPGVQKFWETETATWSDRKLSPPRNVSFGRIGRWDAIIYDTVEGAVTTTHLRVHRVQAGTWIDLQISIVGKASRAEAKASLESFLRSIVVTERDRS